jgi:hypothetical protein
MLPSQRGARGVPCNQCGRGKTKMDSGNRPAVALAFVAVVAIAAAASSQASAPPVGRLPLGPTSQIATQKGQLVAVALPEHSDGRVWRIARPFDSTVLREVREQSGVGGNLVVVFKATGAGNTTISFALTRGERPKAFESRRYRVQVN